MKCIARIQPDRAKCSGYCLLSIARKPNQNLDIAPKSTYQSKNQNGYCSKNHLKITHNGLKITRIHLKIAYIGLKIEAFSILYIETSIILKIDSKNRSTITSKNRIIPSKNRTRVLLKIAWGRINPGGAF
jgi:hypothetical protein